MTTLSREIERQVGVLVDRKGSIYLVLVGDSEGLLIPEPNRLREAEGRLRGLRLLHTHLDSSPLSKDDLNDLTILRLDCIVSIGTTKEGLPEKIYKGHLLPDNLDGQHHRTEGPLNPYDLDKENFLEWVEALEEEFYREFSTGKKVAKDTAVMLIGVYGRQHSRADARLDELQELARSAGLAVVDRVVQRRPKPDPRTWVGEGKLEDILLRALQRGVDILIFDTELTPTQSRNLGERTNLKIVDRSQLILDIFAQRAHSRAGKIQVELAQLKYLLPRLHQKNRAMSRLAGGIGGRGPGETKLEINRRRARDRISRLEKQLEQVARQREVRRSRRVHKDIPIVSVIGYTNAGKSTLINSLTHSNVESENLMFSTLEPVSRRLRFPEEREVIFTDTVGFIRDLPPELMSAFRATLEELQDATVLLHVVDISDPEMEEQIAAVERILEQLELQDIPKLMVLNKTDRMPEEQVENLCRLHQAMGISAMERPTLKRFLEEMERYLWSSPNNRSALEPKKSKKKKKRGWSPLPEENTP